jgi:group II intron reverse transcriptase/maturase
MQPTTEILEKISRNSLNHPDEVFTRLYRYMLRSDLYYLAYKSLYANNGASTKGINQDTADGFGPEVVERILTKLQDGSFQPKPARRIQIPKANGKMRPISIPTFTDKLVQEVMRMILEAVYEPIFMNCSHGFRPKRSCHTALEQVKLSFTGARWFIEGDIKGCFDNIDHQTLIGLVSRKIKDARFIGLLWKLLKAGYLEDWRYHNTFSGTPQGGIISPILANIYLHELDRYVMKLQGQFAKPRDRAYDPRYAKIMHEIRAVNNQLDRAAAEEKPELVKEHKRLRLEIRRVPCKSQTDKRISYTRYADDFLIGVVGSREDCEQIKQELTAFVKAELKMELSEEKTLITHSNTYARFLGYDIRVRRNSIARRTANGRIKRVLNGKVERNIPVVDKIEKFLFSHDVVWKKDGKLEPCHRKSLLHLTDLEIVTAYNAELRGICNYYNLASNFNCLHHFSYLMEYSCLKTLGAKHKCNVAKILQMFKDGKGWSIPYMTQKGEKKVRIATYQDCENTCTCSDVIPMLTVQHLHSRNTFESRLMAHVCELCGSTDSQHYEVHHVHKVKDLKGKAVWEQIMIAKRRKTLVVCRECHKRIHGKKID